MPHSDKKLEILAPAGNFQSLQRAVMCGADAVYLGLNKFNARAKAGNFSVEELSAAVAFCRLFGVKVYVTFNTLYKAGEYDDVLACIKQCHNCGVNAIILQDFALVSRIKSTMPDIVLHLSTQAGVHNLEGALAAERLGFTRVILSREALLSDIKRIKENTSLEIEAFVQGALCVSFSGNCYFSSLVSGYSGNRGKCMQLCRKRYSFKNKQAYWLSPKDVCMKNDIQALIDAGVTSFKIEGRMRRPEYVGEAVNCYKSAITGEKYDITRLKRMFNRGDYTSIYIDNDSEDVIYPYSQNHIGIPFGIVKNVSGKNAVVSRPLSKGDGIKFLRNKEETGSASISASGTKTGFAGNVRSGDEVRLTTDKALCEQIAAQKRYVPFDLTVETKENRAYFTLTSKNASVKIHSDVLQNALSSPLSENDIVACFSKTEDTGLKLNRSAINITQNLFFPKSQLNGLRRSACDELTDEIIKINVPKPNEKPFENVFENLDCFESSYKCIIAAFDDVTVANNMADLYDFAAFSPKNWRDDVLTQLSALNKPFLLVIPNIIRGLDHELVKRVLQSDIVQNVIINNISGTELCKNKKILFGPMMNMLTDEIKCAKILSVEGKNVSPDNFVYVYGMFPLMTFCHCPFRSYNGGKCLKCKTPPSGNLRDEYGNSFTLQSYRLHYCYCRLLNDNPINLTGTDIKTQRKFVDLVGIDEEKCYNILEAVRNGQKLPGGTLAFYNKKLE